MSVEQQFCQPATDNPVPASRSTSVQIRERRLGSITGFAGTAGELVQIARSGELAERERSFTQVGTCSSFCATLQLSLIQDAVVINHAPAGCAGDFPMFNLYNRYGQGKRNLSRQNARLFTTNLNEQDTIFGATHKLAEAIHKAYRAYRPKAIFVTASCTSGIIGEDLESVIEEAEQELGIPIASVNCEGFRSQIWATGWDAAYNSILRKIVRPPLQKQPETINIITFIGEDYFSELLQPIGLKPNLVVPFTGVEQLERLSEASATAHMCSTLGTFLAAGLEREYGVPEIKSPPPYGLDSTDRWLREVATLTGKSAQVEPFIAAERAAIAPQLEIFRQRFAGRKAFVAAGPSHGHSSMEVLQDIGFDLVGSCMFHHDARLDHGDPTGDSLQAATRHIPGLSYGVCNKQAFELVNLLRRLQPDLVIVRHPSLALSVAKLGIPAVFVDDEHIALGYRGLLRYARKLSNWLVNPALERTLERSSNLPYTQWWLSQPPFAMLGEPR
ncbi:MAG TPA: nitrogenase component 1 [Terracidiphilus sp.]